MRMKIGIVGSGDIGSTLGLLWAKAGHQIYFSFSHDEAKLEQLAAQAGNDSKACTPYDAVRCSDVVLFAPPWRAQDEAIKQIGRFEGEPVIDATNPYIDDEMHLQEFGEKDSSSQQIARKLEGAKVIKAFNTLRDETLRERTGQGLVIFYAGDYPVVKKNEIAELIRDAGFEPFDVGPLQEGKKQEPGTDRYLRELTLEEARRLAGEPADVSAETTTTTGEIAMEGQKQPVR